MKKIISLFQRNYDGDRLVRDEITPGAEWVAAGDGTATRKLDGTCCLVRDGKLFKRYEVGKGKTPPPNFEPANEVDPVTGKQQGWLPVGDGPDDRWHREAFAELTDRNMPADGTYELIGPKINGNPEDYGRHALIAHKSEYLILYPEPPRDFAGIRAYLEHPVTSYGQHRLIEGVVWHRENGDMVKIKRKDFFKK